MLPYFSNQEVSAAFSKFHQENNRFTTFSNVPLIKKAVVNGNMLSALPGYAIFHEHSVDHTLLQAVPLIGMLGKDRMPLCLIYRSPQNLRYTEQLLIKCIKEHFAAIESVRQNARFET